MSSSSSFAFMASPILNGKSKCNKFKKKNYVAHIYNILNPEGFKICPPMSKAAILVLVLRVETQIFKWLFIDKKYQS